MRTPDFTHERQVERRPHHVAPNITSVRAIFVIHRWAKPAPGTCDHGLSVTIDGTAKVLRRAGVHAECWRVQNRTDLENRLEADEWQAKRPVTHVIINTPSFIYPYGFGVLAARWPDVEFVQLNHSGISYLSIDKDGERNIQAVLSMQDALHNVRCAGNNPRFTRWTMDNFGHQSTLLPNLYDTETFREPIGHRSNPDPLRIGAFGATRAWKNPGIAAKAAITMARRLGVNLELYVNDSRPDSFMRLAESRAQLFEGLPHAKIVTVPWQPWTGFRKIMSLVDINIFPSFDETFCVCCADGIAVGVPSVVSAAMEWLPRNWWAEPHDQASFARVGLQLLHDRAGAVHDGRHALTAYVENGIQQWMRYLNLIGDS